MLKRTKEFVTEFENVVNLFSDMDREWWPFLFLRPEPHVRMTTLRVALLATLYGGFVGMLANVIVALTSFGPRISVFLFPLYTIGAFFVVYRTTFAYFWNRRAERLAAGLRA